MYTRWYNYTLSQIIRINKASSVNGYKEWDILLKLQRMLQDITSLDLLLTDFKFGLFHPPFSSGSNSRWTIEWRLGFAFFPGDCIFSRIV